MGKLKFRTHFLLLLIGTFVSFNCFAQDEKADEKQYPQHDLTPAPPANEEILYKGSLELGGGIVYPITNKALRTTFNGIYSGHFSANYIFAPHILGGVELENTQFGSNGLEAPYSTSMLIFNAGLKIGYYTFMQNDFLFVYSISGGPSLITYNKTPNAAPKGGFKQNSFFITPNWLASYRVNNELRIGLDITVGVMGLKFDPAFTGLDKYIGPIETNTITTFWEWGFGLYWAFSEAKK